MSDIDDRLLFPEPDPSRFSLTFNGVEIGGETLSYAVLSPSDRTPYVPPRESRRVRLGRWIRDHVPHVHLGPCRPDDEWF